MAGRAHTGQRLFDEAADELYALPLEEFTAARNEWAKRVRADGDAGTAREIGRLPKPNISAWLANHLVRRHRDEIDGLLELGAALRAATSSLDADQLRSLSRQQHQVVHALVGQARRLAADEGQTVSDAAARGLEDTLHAALADERAGEQLARGRLAAPLARSGFPGLDVDAAPAADARRRETAPAADERAGGSDRATDRATAARQAKVERARQDEADARSRAEAARRELDGARTTRDAARATLRGTEDELRQLQDELARAEADHERARQDERRADRALDAAEKAARRADERLADATAHSVELGEA